MKKALNYNLLLLILVIATGCRAGFWAEATSNKKDDDTRPSDESEGVPGYLVDPSLISTAVVDGQIVVSAKPGAVGNAGSNNTLVCINAIDSEGNIRILGESDENADGSFEIRFSKDSLLDGEQVVVNISEDCGIVQDNIESEPVVVFDVSASIKTSVEEAASTVTPPPGGDDSSGSGEDDPPVVVPPPSPENLTADPNHRSVTLTWTNIPSATAYDLRWSLTDGDTANGEIIAGVTSPYTHEGLTNGTPYYYALIARNSAGSSPATTEISATPATVVATETLSPVQKRNHSRRVFLDSSKNVYWAFYRKDGGIEYSWSNDQTTWTRAGAIPAESDDFTVTCKIISGTCYVFVAESSNNDINVYRGVASINNITFESPFIGLNGDGMSSYFNPTLAITDTVWVIANRLNAGQHQLVAANSSNNPDAVPILMNAATQEIGFTSPTPHHPSALPEGLDIFLFSKFSGHLVAWHYDETIDQWVVRNRPGDYSWMTINKATFNAPGPAIVNDIAIHGNDLYVGGNFTDIGGDTDMKGIARWDGSNWNALGAGVPISGPDAVEVVIFVGDLLYAGGNFDNVGGDPQADNLAVWDGSSWDDVGNFGNSLVYSAATDGQNLYVGGNISSAGGVGGADGIAKWDGTSWSALGTGIPFFILGIETWGEYVFAAGSFTNAAGPNGDYVVYFDGTNWNPMGTGLNNQANVVRAYGDHIYVGGFFDNAGGDPNADYIAKWNFTSGWSPVGSGLNGQVDGIIPFGDRIIVAGAFSNVNGNSKIEGIAFADQGSWQPFADSNTLPADVVRSRYVKTGTNSVYSWTVISNLKASERIHDILPYGQDLIIVGNFTDFAGIPEADYAVRWKNGRWQPLSSAMETFNGPVHDVEQHGRVLAFAGNFTDAGGDANADGIVLFDGTNWEAPGSIPALNGYGNKVISRGGSLYVGGNFTDANSVVGTANLARWNGSGWSSVVATGLNGEVHDLESWGQKLVFGGSFTNAGGINEADGLAAIDVGGIVTAFWLGVGGTVYAIEQVGDKLYIGGGIDNVAGTGFYLLEYDGLTLNDVGIDNVVQDLHEYNGELYAVGTFTNANSVANTTGIAKLSSSGWSSIGVSPLTDPRTIVQWGDRILIGGEEVVEFGPRVATGVDQYSFAVNGASANPAVAFTTTNGIFETHLDGTEYYSWSTNRQVTNTPVDELSLVSLSGAENMFLLWFADDVYQYSQAEDLGSAWQSPQASGEHTGASHTSCAISIEVGASTCIWTDSNTSSVKSLELSP